MSHKKCSEEPYLLDDVHLFSPVNILKKQGWQINPVDVASLAAGSMMQFMAGVHPMNKVP